MDNSAYKLGMELRFAAERGDRARVLDLLSRGAYLEAKDEKLGRTALISAAEFGHIDCVRALVEAGADIDAKDDAGLTAAMCSAIEGMAEALSLLASAGADLEAADKRMMTALGWVSYGGGIECMTLLLDAGCDVEKRLRAGTALTEAAYMGDPDKIRLLLDAGARVDSEDGQMNTSAMILAKYGRLEALRLVLEAGADLSHVSLSGDTVWTVSTPECHAMLVAYREKCDFEHSVEGARTKGAALRV